MGEQQLEIVQSMLLEKYKVEIELMRPKVAFRETIRGKSDVEYKYKKQSGGHGQYGHVKMKFEPSGDLEVPYLNSVLWVEPFRKIIFQQWKKELQKLF